MSEMAGERLGSPFYLPGDTFDAVTTTVRFVALLDAVAVERVLECPGIIDEGRCLGHVVSLLELPAELAAGPLVPRGKSLT